MSLNIKQLFEIDYIKGYFDRNKKIFTLSLIICLLFASIGFIFLDDSDILGSDSGYLSDKIDNLNLNQAKHLDEENFMPNYSNMTYEDMNYENYNDELFNALFEDYNLEGFIKLFSYNLSIDLSCIIGGLFFSIPSLIITFNNVSMFGAIFSHIPLLIIIFGILPHGIFEMPSSLFALAGGLMLTDFEYKIVKGLFTKNCYLKDKFNESAYLIKDAIISIAIVFILLFIAAFIETFITPILLYLIF